MKRTISALLVLLFVFPLAGCSLFSKETKQESSPKKDTIVLDTEAPTEGPSSTEPSATEPPAPTSGIIDYCIELETEKLYTLDLDFDGLTDTVYIEEFPNDEGPSSYRVNVGIATRPGRLLIRDVQAPDEFHAWVIDCDPTDCRLEVLATYSVGGKWTSSAVRVKDTGGEMDCFTDTLTIRSDLAANFSSEGGFFVFSSTDILGTSRLIAKMRIDSTGFVASTGDFTYYSDSDTSLSLKLKRKMDVVLLNDDGTEGEEYTIPKGDTIIAVRTDRATYAVVCLPDGRLAKISLEIKDGTVYINGNKQDKYGNIKYAD